MEKYINKTKYTGNIIFEYQKHMKAKFMVKKSIILSLFLIITMTLCAIFCMKYLVGVLVVFFIVFITGLINHYFRYVSLFSFKPNIICYEYFFYDDYFLIVDFSLHKKSDDKKVLYNEIIKHERTSQYHYLYVDNDLYIVDNSCFNFRVDNNFSKFLSQKTQKPKKEKKLKEEYFENSPIIK